MATEVTICNLALSHISNDDSVVSLNPPDDSVAADKCALFYPVARDECLEFAAWSFATRRVSLAELAENPQPNLWGYAYALPSDILRPVAVLLPESTDDEDAKDFVIETKEDDDSQILFTNAESAVLKFIFRQTTVARYTPTFVTGMSYKLAQYLCGPIARDAQKAVAMGQLALTQLSHAAGLNAAKKTSKYKDFIPSQIAARSN